MNYILNAEKIFGEMSEEKRARTIRHGILANMGPLFRALYTIEDGDEADLLLKAYHAQDGGRPSDPEAFCRAYLAERGFSWMEIGDEHELKT